MTADMFFALAIPIVGIGVLCIVYIQFQIGMGDFFQDRELVEWWETLEDRLRTNPEEFRVDRYTLQWGDIEIWIQDSPYADLKIRNTGDAPCPGVFRRSRIRRAIRSASLRKLGVKRETEKV